MLKKNQNKQNGKILTAPGQFNVFVRDDETHFKNSLIHSWDDLRKKHCNMMKEIANNIGDSSYKCDNETLFGACGVQSWCRLCEKK